MLLDTVSALLHRRMRLGQLFIIDQTKTHQPETLTQLTRWNSEGVISWLVLPEPSITAAMNIGLRLAKSPLVLFLDDDIIPYPQLIEGHRAAHQADPLLWASVGQVIQPWQKPEPLAAPRKLIGLRCDFDFPFNSTFDATLQNVMAGNLCVDTEKALSIGGFDENFIGSAYRFESDFARRIIKAGGHIRFMAGARIDHLRSESGGTRSAGNHLMSASPQHGFGDYYYAFRQGHFLEAWGYSLRRLFREVRTKFHLTHPWWIPVKLVGEIRALMLARKIYKQGPKLIESEEAA